MPSEADSFEKVVDDVCEGVASSEKHRGEFCSDAVNVGCARLVGLQ